VWATFYDIRRYGGLQIFLRAIVGGGSMVLSSLKSRSRIMWLACRRTRHAHLRHAITLAQAADERRGFGIFFTLRSPVGRDCRPGRIGWSAPRVSLCLDRPRLCIDRGGVGFAVNDGLEGFPAALIGESRDGVEMKVVDGSLRIRSRRAAHAYVGRQAAALTDQAGFVDTGDMVELRGIGTTSSAGGGGIINIGGLEGSSEEIEAVSTGTPRCACLAPDRAAGPITGAIVVADVILADGADKDRRDQIATGFSPIAGPALRLTRCLR